MDILEAYKQARHPLPKTMLAWPLHRAGLENLGCAGRPVQWPLPEYGPDEILARIDAVGLCYSDIKLLTLGAEHPKVYAPDLASDPIVPGHEVALTVVEVGEQLAGQFERGQRFVVQADIYHQGRLTAFGYALRGGMEQYCRCGEEVLRGDEGCYLLPIDADADYAGMALAEPWACVEAAYRVRLRDHLRPGGTAWFLNAGVAPDADFELPPGLEEDRHPSIVAMTRLPERLRQKLSRRCEELGIRVLVRDSLQPSQFAALSEAVTGNAGFDDIIALGSQDADAIEAAARLVAPNGLLCLVADGPAPRRVAIDIGAIHYDFTSVVGTIGNDIAAPYRPVRPGGSELVEGGLAWFIGSGGAMGQMHVQRAAQHPRGPRLLVAADHHQDRLDALRESCLASAQRRGAELVTLNHREMDPEAYAAEMGRLHGGRGFDDIVLMVPKADQLEEAYEHLAPGGFLNIFAGIPKGTTARLDLSRICRDNVRLVGTSGSRPADLERTLERARQGEITPRRSVAAIGGIDAVLQGLEALRARRFPGKVVIFPQIVGLPLTALSELKSALPRVYEGLEEGKWWTREAEEELFRSLLKMDC